MTHLIIAGIPQDKEFVKAEMLAHHLNRNLGDFQMTVHRLSQQEYQTFCSQEYKEKQWDIRMARDREYKRDLGQLVYYSTGELIGNAEDFRKWSLQSYGQQYDLDDTVLSKIVQEAK
ncbi:hypothetical protein EDD86DRAFT_186571 [Gorgonomyces haynaldii]|nr:hypothetical protein EDD86DRAFT_186571 [Gorgonomyces haynaldii]